MKRSRRLLTLLALLAVALAGCGSGSSPQAQRHHATTKTTTTPAPRVVPDGFTECSDGKIVRAEAGACIRQELRQQGFRLVPPLASGTGAQCIDISRWQGHPQFGVLYRQGIRCVIVQAADNDHASNPYLEYQVRGAHEAGMKVGVYLFAEGAFGFYQADALIAAVARLRSDITLGAAIDAEVDSAYGQVCRVATVLERSFFLVYVYGAPGTYRGGHCTKYEWPASWGTSGPRTLSGYSSSSIVLWQWCGTCNLPGVGEIDRDQDRGLIRLSGTPKPKPKPLTRRQAQERLAKVNKLLAPYDRKRNPHGHNCQHPPFHHAYPSARFNGACAVWAGEARALRKQIG